MKVTTKNDGGPSFPCDMEQLAKGTEGLSVRDYFAAAALQGMLSSEDVENDGIWPETGCAIRCYKFADAMLKAREQ